MKNISKILYSSAFLFLIPFFASAAVGATLQSLVSDAEEIVNTLIVVVFTLALLFFFWGVAKYILKAGNEGEAANGRRLMVGGVIALFVISTIWGLVYFIRGTLDIDDTDNITVPTINGSSAQFTPAGSGSAGADPARGAPTPTPGHPDGFPES